MNFTQRLFFFVIGIVLGSLIVSHMMKQRRIAAGEAQVAAAEIAPVGTEAIQRAAVAGIMRAYNHYRKPMHDKQHVVSTLLVTEGAGEGMRHRFLLLRGKGDSEQVLGIRELIELDGDLLWGDVYGVRIFAADRVLVRTKPDVSRERLVAALEPLSMSIVRGLSPEANPEDPSAPNLIETESGIRMESPADVALTDWYLVGFAAQSADSVLKAQEALGKLAEVASVDFDYLDVGHPYTEAAAK